jgi:DNA polymerase-4
MHLRERSILHLNVADFAVAVERCEDSTLATKAVIIAPLGSARSVVYDMSEEAFQEGVRKNMPLTQAMKRCTGAALLPPRFHLYQKAMTAFSKKAHSFSPQLEYGHDDGHLFLDITGSQRLFGPPPDIGWKLYKESKNSLQLNPIWSIGSNKLIAKVASRLVKPAGEYIVASGDEEAFLAPLSLSLLPGILKKEQLKLYEFNINSIGQLAELSRSQLRIPFGHRSEELYNLCRGIDQTPVANDDGNKKAIQAHHVFAEDTNNQKMVESLVARLAAQCGHTLRTSRVTARRMGIWLTYSDGVTTVRQATTRKETDSDFILVQLALKALQRAWTRRTRLRACTLHCDLLATASPQLSLFDCADADNLRQQQLDTSMDIIRNRFGADAIQTGLQYKYVTCTRSAP